MLKIITYGLRILGWLALALTVLLLSVALLIQTKPVKRKLARLVERQAANFLHARLSIGEIDGNFFTHLSFRNVLLTSQSDTIAFIEALDARYNLRALSDRKLELRRISVGKPFFFLKQINDSTWNVQEMIKPLPPDSVVDTTASKPFEIDLALFQIEEGSVRIDASDTLIPRQVNQINTRLSLNYSGEQQSLRLHDFSFVTSRPDFTVKQLSFDLSVNSELTELKRFYLKTAQNQLNGELTYAENVKTESTARIESAPLRWNEFEFFLPDLKIPATPVFKMDAAVRQGSLIASLELADQDQRISFELESENLTEWIFNQDSLQLIYRMRGVFENIALPHWLSNYSLNYLINGELTAIGKGTDPKTAVVNLAGNFDHCIIEDKPVEQLSFNLNLNQGHIDGIAEGRGNFGRFKLFSTVRDLLGNPSYQLELSAQKLNLAQLTGVDSLKSNLNLTAKISGRGIDPKTLQAQTSVIFSESQLQQIKVDTLFARVNYAYENIRIDSLWLQTKSVRLAAHGNYHPSADSDISLSATIDGMDEFRSFMPAADLQTSGQINARLTGKADSLHLHTTLNLAETTYENYSIGQLLADARVSLTASDTLVDARLTAFNLSDESFNLDSVSLELEAKPDSLYLRGRLAGMGLSSQLETGIRLGDQLRITLNQLLINYKDQQWALQQAPAVIETDSLSYRISNFKMAPAGADSLQYLWAEGQISLSGEEDFRFEAANIDIRKLAGSFEQDVPASGFFGLKVELTGTAASPELTGTFDIREAVVNDFEFTNFGGTMNYRPGLLGLEAQIVPRDGGYFGLAGKLPLQLRLDSMNFNFNPKDSVQFTLSVDEFPLAVLQNLELNQEIKGYLQGAITVDGTVESPDPKGKLELKEASLKIPEYGIDYRNILFNIEFLRDQIRLDTFLIRSADGTLTAGGQIDFNSDFYKGDISQSFIAIRLRDFNPVNHRQFNMKVSGNANLGGKKGEVAFNGDLNIPQAEIYLPAIFRMMGNMVVQEVPKPLLVKEMERMSLKGDTLLSETQTSSAADTFSFDYFNQLTGKLRIKIPRNTWIKNDDLRLELSGDLELIKHVQFFELFGSIDVVRGQYDLFGRTFVINSGSIRFKGGEELIPEMDILAAYTFRNAQRVSQKLTVNITGTATAPSVSFMLDDNSINEGDALSYILFGRGMNELTLDQQENLSGAGGGSLAGTAAASLLSSQITKFLGDKLNVDYIEVKSEGGFDNATVVVGKYITHDLFVSYEQRFGETDGKEMAKYEVKLEYELFRFLFFQLNNSSYDSGFDMIFKFDSK
ncbi:translocation/assembly module TamB domain-containing protein [Gaoshiqia sp. Z1-71]|uniref:translocation/assembly module TamB domain-containing protein n=1 Tax=Gaoshiqia hydrogeniformans TaxID=3290090 RepID=UPI003BF7D9A7